MSFDGKKIKCVSCGAYLFDEDDVVFCPECGAPHHRECYNALGHCAMEDKHGTESQYNFEQNRAVIAPDASNGDNSEKIKCPMCGTVYKAEEKSCPSCGVPANRETGSSFFSFDFLGGVPGDLDLGEKVTANEAKRFVFSNSQRYIPKFAANKLGKKTSFNWFAFLFPCGWFLSRKMYLKGALIGVVQMALAILIMPFFTVAESFMPDGLASYSEVYNIFSQNIDKIGNAAVICAAVSVFINIILRLICGIFGDYFYYKHSISTISQIKRESGDIEEDFRKKGGINFVLFLVGVFAVEYLPGILYSLFI